MRNKDSSLVIRHKMMERRPRPYLIISSILLLTFFVLLLAQPFTSNIHGEAEEVKGGDARDKHRQTLPFHAPKLNIWSELSATEAADVRRFVTHELSHLNLTASPKSARENAIIYVETLRPNKTDAIPYLYGDEDVPERWAKVAVSEIFQDGWPYVVFYMAGPLPISEHSHVRPLKFPFASGRNYIANPVFDFGAITDFTNQVGENISDITQELLHAKVNRHDPSDPKALLTLPRGSRVGPNGLILWVQYFRPGFGSSATTLLPQGIYVKIDATHLDVSEWRCLGFYYNGRLYETEDEFRSALQHPDFARTPANLDGAWTETEDYESTTEGRELAPPVVVQPYGPRYKIDRKEKYVSWFGFEFYLTSAQATGISLFDIKFKGERVMYELGLQEAMAHYAGDDPMQGGQEFLDSFFGMGSRAFELVAGYDCPAYADYLHTDWHQGNDTHTNPNSVCVFEYTADHLLSRHSAEFSVTVSRNTFLVVRFVSTVGNYDYTFDYIFYMDGAFEVKVRASGFIFGAFYTANNSKSEGEYGHRIQNALSSSMHDHVINFKADLDVAGPSNDMVRLAFEPVTKSFPWDQPETKTRNTMHLVEKPVTKETWLDWPKNSQELFVVYNAEKKNAWGERRGYRITSGTGMGATPHLSIINSTTLGDSARWAEHDVWVLRRKDTEPRGADPLNYLAPHTPLINFSQMANGESLAHGRNATDDYDGDLVVYFNLGAHHIPHSGDLPNTLMHTSASAVMFVPHNFHDSDPSRANVQGVKLQLKGHRNSGGFAGNLSVDQDQGGDLRARESSKEPQTKAKYFGATYDQDLRLNLDALEPDLVQTYVSGQHMVTDLGYNGSAAGVWHV